jgi:putative ABC transport system substrate-binding protein
MPVVGSQRSGLNKSLFHVALTGIFFALCVPVSAQQREKVYRIGYLSSGKPSTSIDPGLDAFRQRLRQLGYVEGQNVAIEYRYAELKNERLPELADDLLRIKVDVIVTSPDPPSIRAVQQATRTVPLVMPGTVVDPLQSEFWDKKRRAPLVQSLARPGGNITGLTNLASELHGKRLELLKESFPKISRVAILWPRAQQQKQTLQDIDAVRKALGIEIQSLAAGNLDDFEHAFSEITRERPDALLVARSQVILNHRERVIGFAAKKRLPVIFAESEFVDAGGLMSYGADTRDLYRRAGTYVDKILKGANAGELPIERPTKFEFIINLKTAKQIGLTIPQSVLYRADKVIR